MKFFAIVLLLGFMFNSYAEKPKDYQQLKHQFLYSKIENVDYYSYNGEPKLKWNHFVALGVFSAGFIAQSIIRRDDNPKNDKFGFPIYLTVVVIDAALLWPKD